MAETKPSSSARRRLWLLLLALHLPAECAAIANLSVAEPDRLPITDRLPTLILGVSFAQVVLCAYWAAMGRSRLAWRWSASAALVALPCLAANACLALAATYFDTVRILMVTAAMFLLWFAAQVPWWFLRLRFTWQVGPVDAPRLAHASELQFGIKHIFGWTAAMGVVLCVGRLLSFVSAFRSSFEEWEVPVGFLLLVLFNLVLSILPLWAGLARRRLGVWWLVTVVSSAVVIELGPAAFSAVLGKDGWRFFSAIGEHTSGGAASCLSWLGGAEVAWLLISLLLIRAAGYRLVRRENRQAAASITSLSDKVVSAPIAPQSRVG